jgi:hypothetical protein
MYEAVGSNGSALTVVKPVIEPVSNSLEANVGVLMRRATDVAGVCREIVTRTAQNIQGRKYVRVEGWQAIAVAYGCIASSRDVDGVYEPSGKLIGVKAIGEVRRMSDGVLISTAEGFVGIDEPTWFGGEQNGKKLPPRAMYAIRAMAQTRSESRACRGAFSFVVTLIDSNLATTPAEEMEGVFVEGGSTTPPPPKTLEQKLGAAPQRPSPPRANEPPPHTDSDFRPDGAAHGAATHDREAAFSFGRDKGIVLRELSEASLKWYADCFNRDLASDDPKKVQFHEKTRAQLALVYAELKFRGIH